MKPWQLSFQHQFLYAFYVILWHFFLPVALLYFLIRSRKEPLYRAFLLERFGWINTKIKSPLWIHGASLGELRGVAALIDALLAQEKNILITTLTPAGRSFVSLRYQREIANHRVQISYLPLELPWAVKLFCRRVNATCMMSSEIDTWPVLLHTLRKTGLRLGFLNAQYPKKSFENDQKWWQFRSAFFSAYHLVLCKSYLHAERFRAVACSNVHVTGELRFELPLPQHHLQASTLLIPAVAKRPVICLASVVAAEETIMLDAFADFCLAYSQNQSTEKLPKPLLIYVPRSPQRFDALAQIISERGFSVLRRSKGFDKNLQPLPSLALQNVDVLLGDSLGEMYFYLNLAHVVTVGASFAPLGSHNVIEPLMLHKPVIVGPSIWGIEYPGQEALAAGVLTQVQSADKLCKVWLQILARTNEDEQNLHRKRAQKFLDEHANAVQKHLDVLLPWLAQE